MGRPARSVAEWAQRAARSSLTRRSMWARSSLESGSGGPRFNSSGSVLEVPGQALLPRPVGRQAELLAPGVDQDRRTRPSDLLHTGGLGREVGLQAGQLEHPLAELIPGRPAGIRP